MHMAAIKPAEMIKMLHWQYFHSLIVTVGISLIKLSVASFLLRLVPGKGYKIFLYCMIAFLVAFTCSSAGTLIFSCVPIRASWDAASEPNAKCFSNATFTAIGMFNSCVNIVTDVLFATLPIPMVWNLQVNLRTKLSLIAILSLGFFACAASIVKTVIQTRVLSNPDSTRNDSYFIWNSIELYIGILAASLPSLRPLFRSILETTRSLRTRGISSSANMGGARHKYYIHDDGIGMNSLQSAGVGANGLGRVEGLGVDGVGKYDVRITTRGLGGSKGGGAESLGTITGTGTESNKSEEEVGRGRGRGGSESSEDVWPLQGIKKTVDVTVT
ncbi:hypothetical protein EG329_001397 [Mollisiaceae sp. DMI_Dod_QoI]|nr:hypothetical protein EG329_001397 [Helotiales sp. DMI_Dod_QoI]